MFYILKVEVIILVVNLIFFILLILPTIAVFF